MTFRLAPDLIRLAEEFARSERTTSFVVLLTAYKVLLLRLTGQSDVIVGALLPAAIQSAAGFSSATPGATVALRTSLDGNAGFREAVRRVAGDDARGASQWFRIVGSRHQGNRHRGQSSRKFDLPGPFRFGPRARWRRVLAAGRTKRTWRRRSQQCRSHLRGDDKGGFRGAGVYGLCAGLVRPGHDQALSRYVCQAVVGDAATPRTAAEASHSGFRGRKGTDSIWSQSVCPAGAPLSHDGGAIRATGRPHARRHCPDWR